MTDTAKLADVVLAWRRCSSSIDDIYKGGGPSVLIPGPEAGRAAGMARAPTSS